MKKSSVSVCYLSLNERRGGEHPVIADNMAITAHLHEWLRFK